MDNKQVNKSWCGAQGKGPIMDLLFYVLAIKIDANGLRPSQGQCVLRHHVKCKLTKIPQLAMDHNVKEMGA